MHTMTDLNTQMSTKEGSGNVCLVFKGSKVIEMGTADLSCNVQTLEIEICFQKRM